VTYLLVAILNNGFQDNTSGLCLISLGDSYKKTASEITGRFDFGNYL
jgi:hypothetical protein